MRHLPARIHIGLQSTADGRGNPLRRRSDRVEQAAGAAGLVVLLLALPVAVWLGVRSYAGGQRAIHEQAPRQRVIATLTEAAPVTGLVAPDVAATPGLAAARWSTADGTQYAGYVRAAAGTPAGAGVQIWIDQAGQPVPPPITGAAVVRSAIGVGVCTLVAAALLVLLALGLLRQALDRTRVRAWDAEWAAVEPQWTGHRI